MIRRLGILVLLFVLVWTGVEFWYGRLKEQLAAAGPSPVEKVAATGKAAREAQHNATGPAAGRQSGKPGNDAAHKDDYQVIVQRNIFGAVLEQEAVAREEKKPAEPEPEKSTLKLTLLGTVSGNERDARAIIVDEKEKKQDIYQIGDAVQGALITEIKRGKVILDVDGRRQFLVIKERKQSGGSDRAALPGSRDLATSSFIPSRTVPAASRPAPAVVPHRRVSFRQRKKEVIPAQEPALPENAAEQDPEMDIMPGEAEIVE